VDAACVFLCFRARAAIAVTGAHSIPDPSSGARIHRSTQNVPDASFDSDARIRRSTHNVPGASFDSDARIRRSTHNLPDASFDSDARIHSRTHNVHDASFDSDARIHSSTRTLPDLPIHPPCDSDAQLHTAANVNVRMVQRGLRRLLGLVRHRCPRGHLGLPRNRRRHRDRATGSVAVLLAAAELDASSCGVHNARMSSALCRSDTHAGGAGVARERMARLLRLMRKRTTPASRARTPCVLFRRP
jgi:hypothetical protein